MDEVVSNMNEKLILLYTMKQNFESVEEINPGEYQETVRAIAEQSEQDLTEREMFWYPQFIAGQAPVEAAVGTLTRVDRTTLTSYLPLERSIPWNSNENPKGQKTANLMEAETIKCTGNYLKV